MIGRIAYTTYRKISHTCKYRNLKQSKLHYIQNETKNLQKLDFEKKKKQVEKIKYIVSHNKEKYFTIP